MDQASYSSVRQSLNTKCSKENTLDDIDQYTIHSNVGALHKSDNDRMNMTNEDYMLDEQVSGKFPYLFLLLLHVLKWKFNMF